MTWTDGNFDVCQYMAMSGGQAVTMKIRAGAAARSERVNDRRYIAKQELAERIAREHEIRLVPGRNKSLVRRRVPDMSRPVRPSPALSVMEIEKIQNEEERQKRREKAKARKLAREAADAVAVARAKARLAMVEEARKLRLVDKHRPLPTCRAPGPCPFCAHPLSRLMQAFPDGSVLVQCAKCESPFAYSFKSR